MVSNLRGVVVKGTRKRSVKCVNAIIVLKLAITETPTSKSIESSYQGNRSMGRGCLKKSHSGLPIA